MRMLRFVLSLVLCFLPLETGKAITVLDASTVNKSVVFLFGADSAGVRNDQLATGFLVGVPNKNEQNSSYFLVTARHVVDPVWAGCSTANPNQLFVRVNKKRFNPKADETGVSYVAVELY
jgi:hypothetical protein